MRTGLARAGASIPRGESGLRHSVATETATHALWPTRSRGAAAAEPPDVVVAVTADVGVVGAPTAAAATPAAAVSRMVATVAPMAGSPRRSL